MVSKALRMQNGPIGPGGPRKHQEDQLNLSPYMRVNRNTLIRYVALGGIDFEQGRSKWGNTVRLAYECVQECPRHQSIDEHQASLLLVACNTYVLCEVGGSRRPVCECHQLGLTQNGNASILRHLPSPMTDGIIWL